MLADDQILPTPQLTSRHEKSTGGRLSWSQGIFQIYTSRVIIKFFLHNYLLNFEFFQKYLCDECLVLLSQ